MLDMLSYDELSGSVQECFDQIVKLEDGEVVKVVEQLFYEYFNYGMFGVDVGLIVVEGMVVGLSVVGIVLVGGVIGGVVLGVGVVVVGIVMFLFVIVVGGVWVFDKVGVIGWLLKEFIQVGDVLGFIIG